MKKTALPLLASAVLLGILGTAVLAEEDATTTMTGSYNWTQRGNSGDLEAVFTPTGEGQWDVDFHFTFREEEHTYSGSARGSLSDGPLEGEVLNENKRRSFTFEGKFRDGKFKGTHAETTGGKPADTGTLTLSP